jgi:phytoene synthase
MTSLASPFQASSFAPAFFLLSRPRRRALQSVYAFCRAIDDWVDERPPEEARKALQAWRDLLQNPRLARPAETVDPAVWSRLQEAVESFSIPASHLLGLVDGVERDLSTRRYATFEDLKVYCFGVASTVGLACLPIFGLDENGHRDFAVTLGLAVQLVNILRDVRSDAARGRIYLPQQDMKRFGYAEEELLKSAHTPAFVRLMRFEANRARELFAQAYQSLPPLSRSAARPALLMGKLYQRLLENLDRMEYNVFTRRAKLSPGQKLKCVIDVFREGLLATG